MVELFFGHLLTLRVACVQVVEFDTPYALVEREGGVLAELVAQTGDASRERLIDMARQAHLAAQERLIDMARQAHLAAQQRLAAPEDVSLSL